MNRLQLIAELLQYAFARRRATLLPVILALAVVGLLIVFAEASPLAPVMYPLF